MKYSGTLKGMVKDLDELNLSSEQYTFALNAYTADKTGNERFRQNGASNLLGWQFDEGEQVIGKIYISELDILLVFTTLNRIISLSLDVYDDTKANLPSIEGSTEIAPLETITQTPILSGEVVASSECFNFSIQHKIDIEYKITPTTLNLYFVDGYNENRYIYFNRENGLSVHNSFLQHLSTDANGVKQYGGIDCNKIRWNPNVSYPDVSTEIVDGGKLLAGVYQVLVAYSTSKGIELTPYKSTTNPIHIFTKQLTPTTNYDTGKALSINIKNLETNSRYQFINIVVLETIDGVSTYNLVSTLPISSEITYLYTGENIKIRKDESEIFSNFIFYKSAKNITKGNEMLFLSNLKEYEKINIQRIANMVKLKWFTIIAKEGEYKKPEFAQNYKTYPRDEVFPFGIKLILDNGEETAVGHIPGRIANNFDLEMVCRDTDHGSNYDVIINDDECKNENCKPRWQVYNTAKETQFHSDVLNECEYTIHSEGEFSYWESTDLYPNDKELFGELANTPIRHHKFPDCLVSPFHDGNDTIYVSFTGTNKIYPLGVKVDGDISQILQDALKYNFITEEQYKRIVGYKIVRGNRANHKSVVAKGLLYDTFKYRRNRNGNKYIYPNYPFNDLRPDPYLSGDDPEIMKEQLRIGGTTNWSKNIFVNEGKYTFHSPDTHFVNPTIPSILKIEQEVHGEAEGFFNKSEGQAEYVLLDQGWYNLAIVIGVHVARGLTAGNASNASDESQQIGSTIGGAIGTIWGPVGTVIGGTVGGLAGRIIGGLGDEDYYAQLAQSYAALSQAEKVLQLFQNIINHRNYHYQYQAIGKYSNIEKIPNEGNKQREIIYSEYIGANARQTVNNEYFDNFGRESSVYLQVDKLLPNTTHIDKSRFTISETPNTGCNYVDGQRIKSNIASYYVSLKRNILNQYGNIFDIEYIPVSNKVWKLNEQAYEFGGDTFIGRFALKRKHHFFTNTAYNLPNGTDIYYEELYNQGVPRYFFNTRYSDIEDPILTDEIILPTDDPLKTAPWIGGFFATIMTSFYSTNQSWNLDNLGGSRYDSPQNIVKEIYNNELKEGKQTIWTKIFGGPTDTTANFLRSLAAWFKAYLLNPFRMFKPPRMNLDCLERHIPTNDVTKLADSRYLWKAYFNMSSLEGKIYTYSYGIPYFLCESDVNLDLRYATNTNEHDFYPHQQDLNYWLQQKNVNPMADNTFYYNRTYSKQNKEEINLKYDIDFIQTKDQTEHRNRVIYSQRGAEVESINTRDNYLYFKPLDSFDFTYENGLLTGIDSIEGEKILVRFENNTRIFSSFDTLRTNNGIDVSLGTGSLFGGRPQEFSKTDLGFLGSQHSNILSTEYGHIIVDALRGQIFKLGSGGSGLDILSNKGMRNWFKEHLPFHIKKYIKNVDIDNEYNGIGISISYNKRYDGFHLTKLDYIPKYKNITYSEGKFFLEDEEISLNDTRYFCNASWTISYSFPEESWVSFHTFTPNYYIDKIDTFYTGINGNPSSLWGHNLTNKSYQVYYGQLHPFIIEGFSSPSIQHKLLTHVSFLLTTERFHNSYDSFVREYVSFNKAIVYNETQNSGILELEMHDPLYPFKTYPIINENSRTIKIDNKEDVYSFNQFIDLAHTNLPRFNLSCNGVYYLINQAAINYKKLTINNGFMSNNVNFIKLINDKYSNYKMTFKGFLLNEIPSVR